MKELSAKMSSESMTVESGLTSVLTEGVLTQSASSHSRPGTILNPISVKAKKQSV